MYDPFFQMHMKQLLILILLSTTIISCYENNSCVPNYIGMFKINDSLVHDALTIAYIKQFGWDTVTLVSDSTGNYYFDSNNPILKKVEGKWHTESNDIEGIALDILIRKIMRRVIQPMHLT